MPEPQRSLAMKILIEEAKAAKVPPAMLVTHLPHAEEMKLTAIRCRVVQRIHAEVEGAGLRMLARAFRRDCRRIKDLIDGVYGKKRNAHNACEHTTPRNEA
jgi:hypothetical protein